MPRRTTARIVLAAAASTLALASLTACSGFNPPGWVDTNAPTPSASGSSSPAPTATCDNFGFTSVFSAFGTVNYTLILAPGLTLTLNMYTEQKTHEWYFDTDKQLSYSINVVDSHAAERDPFVDKRRVYMSRIVVNADTVEKDGQTTAAYTLDADPRTITLDPEALQSKKYGLLITSPKGGLLYEHTKIGVLPDDTYGLNLDFELTISSESTKGSNRYHTETYPITLPIAIFSDATQYANTSCATNSTLEPSYAPGAQG